MGDHGCFNEQGGGGVIRMNTELVTRWDWFFIFCARNLYLLSCWQMIGRLESISDLLQAWWCGWPDLTTHFPFLWSSYHHARFVYRCVNYLPTGVAFYSSWGGGAFYSGETPKSSILLTSIWYWGGGKLWEHIWFLKIQNKHWKRFTSKHKGYYN